MLTAILFIALVLPAMFLGHMAHEEILSQKAYRKASRAHTRPLAPPGGQLGVRMMNLSV